MRGSYPTRRKPYAAVTYCTGQANVRINVRAIPLAAAEYAGGRVGASPPTVARCTRGAGRCTVLSVKPFG